MSTASVTALINALRAETRENSISPESLGYILQKMIDEHAQSASGSGSSSTDSAAILALQALITSLDSSVTSLTSATAATAAAGATSGTAARRSNPLPHHTHTFFFRQPSAKKSVAAFAIFR